MPILPDETVELRCTTGNHNKFYRIEIEQLVPGDTLSMFYVWAQAGRMGLAGRRFEKGTSHTIEYARVIRDNLIAAKRAKGYIRLEIEPLATDLRTPRQEEAAVLQQIPIATEYPCPCCGGETAPRRGAPASRNCSICRPRGCGYVFLDYEWDAEGACTLNPSTLVNLRLDRNLKCKANHPNPGAWAKNATFKPAKEPKRIIPLPEPENRFQAMMRNAESW